MQAHVKLALGLDYNTNCLSRQSTGLFCPWIFVGRLALDQTILIVLDVRTT